MKIRKIIVNYFLYKSKMMFDYSVNCYACYPRGSTMQDFGNLYFEMGNFYLSIASALQKG